MKDDDDGRSTEAFSRDGGGVAGLVPGTLVGEYRVLRPVGRGATSDVYLAEHRLLGRKAAVKVLRQAGRESDLPARLVQEARLLSSFAHPHLLELYDCGELANGGVFMATELVPAGSLEEWVA